MHLVQRCDGYTFPYLEEAEAFQGAVLLATTAEAGKDGHARFSRSFWRSGRKRRRGNRIE